MTCYNLAYAVAARIGWQRLLNYITADYQSSLVKFNATQLIRSK